MVRLLSSSALRPRRRVLPKTAICAFFSLSSLAALEELRVLGIGARPAALDVVDAQLVQLPGDMQLVHHREGNAFALGAVP